MRETFSKDFEIDQEMRNVLVTSIKEKCDFDATASQAEEKRIKQGKNFMRAFEVASAKKTTIRNENEFVSVSGKTIAGRTRLEINATIRCNYREVLAFFIHVDSRAMMDGKLEECGRTDLGGRTQRVNVAQLRSNKVRGWGAVARGNTNGANKRANERSEGNKKSTLRSSWLAQRGWIYNFCRR